MKISNETKVGILATFAIVLVILGINFLKGKNVFSRNIILYAKYTEVEGLTPSNPVMLYGLKVGQVDAIDLINEKRNKLLVRFHIQGDVSIPKNSVISIASQGLLGSMALVVTPGNSPLAAAKYDTLPGKVEESLTESLNKVVAPVKDKVEKLIGSIDTVVTGLNEVFNEDTKRNLRYSFNSIKNSMNNIENTTTDLNGFVGTETKRLKLILENINRITENLKNNNATINRAINNFALISDSLRAANLQNTIKQTNEVIGEMNKIIAGIQKGDGSLGKLVNDDQLYKNLQSASDNLDKLVADLKENPDRYLTISLIKIGGKEKKKKK